MTSLDSASLRQRALESAEYALVEYLQVNRCRRLWCFTDPGRKWLAESFTEAAKAKGLKTFLTVLETTPYPPDDLTALSALVNNMTEQDLIVAVFSEGTFIPAFPSFRSPQGFRGVSGFIRPRYPDQELVAHLHSGIASVESTARQALELKQAKTVRVTTAAGTDLTCQLRCCIVLPYQVTDDCRHAYLPASEVSYGLDPTSAQGEIVVDVTVGEFARMDQRRIVDPLGLVDQPVRLTVRDGLVTDIRGGAIAERLKACFESVSPTARHVVELGFGLAQGSPMGFIAVDECLQGTCHFGIGNDQFYGGSNSVPVHLDVVISQPQLQILEGEPRIE